MLKLRGSSKLNPLISLREKGKLILNPYMNSDLTVLSLGEVELRGKLFMGVRVPPRLNDDDMELILFMKQDGKTRLKTLLRQISPGWNKTHTGIVEFDGVVRARMFGNVMKEQFRWRNFGCGAFQTRYEIKERLRNLGLSPAVMDCVFPTRKN